MAEDLQDQEADYWAARLGVSRDVLLRCLRALREADNTGAGLNLVERLLYLVAREGRTLH
jgi:hypothetical protein